MVRFFLSAPLFRESPQDQFALTRSSLALPCSAEGDPKPLVFWMQEGNALLREQGLTISENGTLLISEVGLHHAGHYTCYATDGQTTISASAKIRVEERKGTYFMNLFSLLDFSNYPLNNFEKH